jgi:hypothetical protein
LQRRLKREADKSKAALVKEGRETHVFFLITPPCPPPSPCSYDTIPETRGLPETKLQSHWSSCSFGFIYYLLKKRDRKGGEKEKQPLRQRASVLSN